MHFSRHRQRFKTGPLCNPSDPCYAPCLLSYGSSIPRMLPCLLAIPSVDQSAINSSPFCCWLLDKLLLDFCNVLLYSLVLAAFCQPCRLGRFGSVLETPPLCRREFRPPLFCPDGPETVLHQASARPSVPTTLDWEAAPWTLHIIRSFCRPFIGNARQ